MIPKLPPFIVISNPPPLSKHATILQPKDKKYKLKSKKEGNKKNTIAGILASLYTN